MLAPYKADDLRSSEPKTYQKNLHGFIAWLEGQDGSKTYNWDVSRECIATAFLNAIGHAQPSLVLNHAELFGDGRSFFTPRYHAVTLRGLQTYSAALERARALEATDRQSTSPTVERKEMAA